MPTCVKCGRWYPPSEQYLRCPCGGDLETGAGPRRLEAKAAERGMTLDGYRDMQHAERAAPREAEERQAERIRDAMEKQGQTVPRHWDHRAWDAPDFGQAEGLILIIGVLPVTALLGAVLLAVFWVLSLPVWVPVLAGVIGVVGGAVLAFGLYHVSWLFLDRLAYRSSWVDRNGDSLYFGLVVVAWVLPLATLLAATGILFWIAA